MRLCHMRDYLHKFRILRIAAEAGKIQVFLFLYSSAPALDAPVPIA